VLGHADIWDSVRLSLPGFLWTIPWLWQASHQLICCATTSFWYMAWLQCRVDQADTPWDTVVSGFTHAVSCPVLTACFYLVLPCLVLFYLIMVAKTLKLDCLLELELELPLIRSRPRPPQRYSSLPN
jgi:hypothetical protein